MSLIELKSMSPEKLDDVYWQYDNITQMAIVYGVHRDSVRNLLRKNKVGAYSPNALERCQIKQDEVAPILTECLRLTGDWILSADWHIPTHNLEWVSRLIGVARKLKIRKLVIGGDFINFDALSYFYLREGGKQTTVKLESEYEEAEGVMDVLETWFDEIVWILGNHEWRFMRVHRWGTKPEKLLSFVNRLCDQRYKISGLSYLYVDDIRVTHPQNYRSAKLSMANALSTKFRCPVVQAHGHFLSLGYSTGGYRIGDTGCLCNPDRTDYIAKADTTHPRWNNGFLVYKDGNLTAYGKGLGMV